MTIAEHTVRLMLLPTNGVSANILDLGCRGFDFAKYFEGSIHKVYCVDIGEFEGNYHRIGVSDKDGTCGAYKHPDPQATYMIPGTEIPMMTLDTLSKFLGVEHWDLIKMDIEGEELKILETAQHPIADQVSVEFHAHCGGQTRAQIDELLDKLKEWYYIENRIWEDRHCAGGNYWDVLLIAKPCP